MKKEKKLFDRDKEFVAFMLWYAQWRATPFSNEREFERRASLQQGVMSKYRSKDGYRPRPETLKRMLKVAHELGMPKKD